MRLLAGDKMSRLLHDNIECLLLDCDGTIAETEKDLTLEQFNEAFRQTPGLFHVTWDVDTYSKLLKVGASQARYTAYFDANPHLWPNDCISDLQKRNDFADLMKQRKDEQFETVWRRKRISLLPGVARIIDEAIESNIPIAVCSNSNYIQVKYICSMLLGSDRTNKINSFQCGDMAQYKKNKKPDPLMYLNAAHLVGVDPKNCLVIEDSRVGLLAGKSAGCKVIVTPSYFTKGDDFTEADYVCTNLDEGGVRLVKDSIEEQVIHKQNHWTELRGGFTASASSNEDFPPDRLVVCVTGGAGRIAYSLLPLICVGQAFGPTTRIDLRLLDIPQCKDKAEGVAMELEDCNYSLLEKITAYDDPAAAFKDCDVAVLLGGFPRGPGMERVELISKNAIGMKLQAKALAANARQGVKVLVVANPANTNCLVAMKNAPSIPPSSWSCLTMLDQIRAEHQVVKAQSRPCVIEGVVVFGNHSPTMVPYLGMAKFQDTGLPIELPVDTVDELISVVQARGAAIIKKQQASSGLSAAHAIAAHLMAWLGPSDKDRIFSMGKYSTGNPYIECGVPEDIFYSFPVLRSAGSRAGLVEIVPPADLKPFTPRVLEMLQITSAELLAERRDAQEFLN